MKTRDIRIDNLEQELFRGTGKVYAVLDGAAIPDLPGKLWELEPKFECLYLGALEPDIAQVAPYLVCLEQHCLFTVWLLKNAPERNWGVFAVSSADLHEVRHHFRRMLTVHDERGRPMAFRFYDPRVFRMYLPTCTDSELTAIFGPVPIIVAESGDGHFQRF
jgi:hypothetical protein